MSVNAVDQTTGNTTPLAGNTNNLVGNLSALTTNTKSDAVGAINEVNQTKQNATDNNLQTTDKTIVGGINELKSGLTSLNSHRIELETFNTGTNAQTLSFAGTAHCRRANMLLLLSTQGKAVPPIVVGFTGASQGYETILDVYVSDNDSGVTASDSSISIPAELSSYGTHTIVKLYPDDDVTITVSQ